MTPFEELFDISEKLSATAALSEDQGIALPLVALDDAANALRSSFSGSWLGYHSRVYYQNFKPARAGANFSQEWGLQDVSLTGLGSTGEWREYSFDEVVVYIKNHAGNPDLSHAENLKNTCNKLLDSSKSEIISILEIELAKRSDSFLSKLKLDIEKLEPTSKIDVINYLSPKGQVMTRDMVAMGQGTTVPPHFDVLERDAM